jgi:hypothetical protein
LDAVFGTEYFKNEIIWKRTSAHANVGKKYGIINDNILFYTKFDIYTWNPQHIGYSNEHIENSYRFVEPETERYYASRDLTASMQRASSGQLYEWKGVRPPLSRCWAYTKEQMEKFETEGKILYSKKGYPRLKVYLDEMPGIPLQSIWLDVPVIAAQSTEKIGYPTQKPVALLERIIQASSNEGDIVLDPFCGCGTAIHAAQALNRNWIGIDITHLAISIVEKRMKDAFPDIIFQVYGTPKDLDSAKNLADRDKYQFQWWACSLVNAQPYQGKKKGADTGIDGLIFFQDDEAIAKKIIVSVKGGANVSRTMIADLKNTIVREKAEIGLFVTLAEPTKPMITEAVSAGFYESKYMGAYPKIQILTIEHLLTGMAKPNYPDLSRGGVNFKKPPVEQPKIEQEKLL